MKQRDKEAWELEDKYLAEVKKSLSGLNYEQSREVIEGITEHIDEASNELEGEEISGAEMSDILKQLGPPEAYSDIEPSLQAAKDKDIHRSRVVKKEKKLITPIHSTPVTWAEKVAGSLLRMNLFIFIHIVFISGGLFTIYWLLELMNKLPEASPNSTLLAILIGSIPIVFIGVGLPAFYIYAISKLLKIIRNR